MTKITVVSHDDYEKDEVTGVFVYRSNRLTIYKINLLWFEELKGNRHATATSIPSYNLKTWKKNTFSLL